MFDLTSDQKTLIEQEENLLRQNRLLHSNRLQTYGQKATDIEAEIAIVEKELLALRERPDWQVATAKAALGAKLNATAGNMPVGVLLSMVEEVVQVLDSNEVERVLAIGKDLLLRGLAMAADEDVARARADLVKVRYQALVEAGLPADLIRDLIVAEAMRPWPSSPMTFKRT